MFRLRLQSAARRILTQPTTTQTTYQSTRRRISTNTNTSSATPLHTFTPRVNQSADIRSSFLNYFQSHQHQLLPSSSLIPQASDETLLFTNAGMVQLKDMFTGLQAPPPGSNGRLVSAQKCIRAGGKHNDLENVGYTARHHTFFEMLGNFSVGNYFKEEAILLAWNYLTKEIGLPPSRLRISIHQSDDEAARLWSKISGFSESNPSTHRIIRLGDADNFWSMGDTPGTPCGPCSEIFFDQGKEVDGDRWLEIWNLVFMQYARGKTPNDLIPLQKPCVDTGMGLERLASVLQHQPTNYDSDLLRPSIEAVRQLALLRTNSSSTALPYTNGLDPSSHATAFKVIVDHLRSSAFLIAEGVIPSNIGRGYVLRRIIRRAIRFGTTIGLNQPFLTELLDPLINKLGSVYPELIQRRANIESILKQEEINFFATLHRGMKILDDAFAKHAPTASSTTATSNFTLPGEVAFLLYDSFGFPLDLTQVIARERGASVDTARFEQLMKQQKEQSKGINFQTSSSNATAASADGKSSPVANLPIPTEVKRWQLENITNKFTGYDTLENDGPIKVLASEYSSATNSLWLALESSPFYANQGGQVGDIGELFLEDGQHLQVVDCVKPYDGCSVVRVHVPTTQTELAAQMRPGTMIARARVDPTHRSLVAIHHTATHLLHAALKQVLTTPLPTGTTSTDSTDKKKKSSPSPTLTASSINQAGSLVAPDRLRFDFSCPTAITSTQLAAIEDWINQAILSLDAGATSSSQQPIPTIQTEVMSKDDAMKRNAMALFGEKYGSTVRVVTIPGYSIELCGGTHVQQIRSVYPFKILSEGGIASGIRRIEAVAGPAAFKYLDQAQTNLKRIATDLKTPLEQVATSVTKLQSRVKELEDEIVTLKSKALLSGSNSETITVVEMSWSGATKPLSIKIHPISSEASPNIIREACTSLASSDPSSYHLLLSPSTGSLAIAAGFAQSGVTVTAKQLWQLLDSRLTQDGPNQKLKGGGSDKIAQGILPTHYTTSPDLTLNQRIRNILNNNTPNK